MAQQDKLTYEGTFNNSTSGLFKDNTSGDIEAVDHRLQVTNTKDSVPFTLDDSYTWPFPQVTASGTDTYTATLSPPITAYVAGQKFQILFTNANTGASTLNLNAVGALAITKNGATALAAGDIPAGSIKILAYDGTRLQIVGDGGGGGTAATTSFTPAGGIAATDVQAAIEELDTEKAPLASPALTGTPTAPTPSAGDNDTSIATTAYVQTEIVGVQDLFIPASAMWPRVTGGCGPVAAFEMATSLFNVQALSFDQTTQEFAQCQVVLPRKWNNGTITVVPYWTATSGAGTVQWGISGGAYSNDDALTVALGTAQTSDDTLIAANDLHIGPATAAITLAGTPADADFLAIQISRNPASDTLTADALLLGISVRITTDAAVDS